MSEKQLKAGNNSEVILAGALNGITIAVRRGDIKLLSQCYGMLKDHDGSRIWLRWHLPLTVLSEAWYLIPFLQKLAGLDNDKADKAVKQFLTIATRNPKSRDVISLVHTVMLMKSVALKRFIRGESEGVPDIGYLRHQEYLSYLDAIEAGPDEYAGKDTRKMTKFETDGYEFLIKRVMESGKVQHQHIYLAGLILLNQRGIPQKTVGDRVELGKQVRWPRVDEELLPWYCYTPETWVGKTALESCLNEKGHFQIEDRAISRYQVELIWQLIEVMETETNEVGLIDKPTCFDSMWWPCLRDTYAIIPGLTHEETRSVWNSHIQPRISEAVYETLKGLAK